MASIKASAPQHVVDYLKKNIADGAWTIGDKIPSENALSKHLGVSRPSVRLAIQRFIATGVLESKHGKGTFVISDDLHAFADLSGTVTQEDSRDVAKMLEFRRIVEPEACYLAMERADRGLVGRLKACLDAMLGAVGRPEEFVRHDMAFHHEICKAAQNPVLERSLRDVFALTQRHHQKMTAIFGYKDAIYYHLVLFKAFEMRDGKQARIVMAEQLQSSIDQLSHPD